MIQILRFKPALRTSLAAVLVLAMLLSTALPDGVVRADVEGDYTYTLSGGNATITDYTGLGGAVVIPSTLGGYSVTSIGDVAFSYCSGLASVTIPDSVTSIGEEAFLYCTGLTSITVAAGNTAYSSQDGVLFNKAKTSILQYPGGKTGSYEIPDNVTSIGVLAFYCCWGLTRVTIPDSVTSISHAFHYCTGLTSITVAAGNTAYSSQDGVLFNKAKTSILQYPGGKSGSYEIPDSVIIISYDAFGYCSGLTSVTIPDSVTSISYYAFRDCTGLTSVTIPDSVTSIGDSAFWNCTGLTSVTIPDSVTSIGDDAFWNCTGLTSITVAASNTTYSSQDGVLFNKAKTSILQYPGGKSGSYEIPDSVIIISYDAFGYCSGLTSVTIPDSVTSISYYAFRDCTGLTSVTIPDSVTSIGVQAFVNCWGLTAAYFLGNAPTTMGDIRDRVFYGCATGFTIYYISGKTGWTTPTWHGYPTSIVTIAKAITAFTIPGQVGPTTIDEGAYTVTLTMPYGTVLTALVPTIAVSAGATVSPASGVGNDFSSPVTYTVTAAGGSIHQHYTVTVTVAPPANVTLTLVVHDGSNSGPPLAGVLVTGTYGNDSSFSGTTDSAGSVTLTGAPGTWHFITTKTGYAAPAWSWSITTTGTRDAYMTQTTPSNVTLTLIVLDESPSVKGIALPGARVVGHDADDSPFDSLTDSDGRLVINGVSGTWQFTASKTGYQPSSWSQQIDSSCEKRAFLFSNFTIPRFLTLPFKDQSIAIQQGWNYNFLSTHGHEGIDYIKGTVNSAHDTWQTFDVVAAADGVATAGESDSYGNYVLIRHNEKDNKGYNYLTLYAHLSSIASNIDSVGTPVARGDFIGKAGDTGSAQGTGIHLHFEVNRSAYTMYRVDPYGVYSINSDYPGPGARSLWTTNPPRYPTNPPVVTAFDLQPRSCALGQSITATYTVSDPSGPNLQQVELWRTTDPSTWPSPPNPLQTTNISGSARSGQFVDTPLSIGTYWYGIHVTNNTDWGHEQSPIQVTVLEAAHVVTFPDANLEAVIRQAISKPAGDIHASELSGLTALDANTRGIISLSGLEYCTILTVLELNYNQISNLAPLAGLTNLTNLELSNNQISDLTPLAGLTKLTALDLNYNQISDIAPLVSNMGLDSGDRVDLRNNPLNQTSVDVHIPTLKDRGVSVLWDTAVPIIIYVPDDNPTIQSAVDAAHSGDTIIVRDGTYIENVTVNKDHLTIQSENGTDNTIVQAANPEDHNTFHITANSVDISGFTVSGSSNRTGISIEYSDNCTLTNNKVTLNGGGIQLYQSRNCALMDNIVTQNYRGIILMQCGDLTLKRNQIFGNTYNFGFSGWAAIWSFVHDIDTSNTVDGKPIYYWIDKTGDQVPSDAGCVVLVNCSNITVKNLDLNSNSQGLILAFSRDSKVENTRISNNTLGIWLFESNNNCITNCIASDNEIGFYLVASSNNLFTKNTMMRSKNSIGLEFLEASQNTVYLNNFVIDTVGLSHSTNIWNSPEAMRYTYSGITYTNQLGNYWNSYTGGDAKGDGIGDMPYNIDSDRDNYPLMKTFENYGIGTLPPDTTPPFVLVEQPNGDETWQAGSSQIILWKATDNTPGNLTYRLYYSVDSDTPILIKELTDQPQDVRGYVWPVPAVNSTNCKIMIEAVDGANNVGSDQSDDVFTIDSFGDPIDPLDVPWIVQCPGCSKQDWNENASCGQTSFLIVSSYWRNKEPTEKERKELNRSVGCDEFYGCVTEPSKLRDLASNNGFPESYTANNWNLSMIKSQIDDGFPVIVAVGEKLEGYYQNNNVWENITCNYSIAGHWLVVKGYTETQIICSDPGTIKGKDIRYFNDDFESAMYGWKSADWKGAVVVVVPPSTGYVQTSTGTGQAYFATDKGGITGLTALFYITNQPASVTFTQGLFDFTITGIKPPGSTVTITITFPTRVPEGALYLKHHNGIWKDCTSLMGHNDGDNILTLTIKDGGLGDSDGLPNGVIHDPGGPAIPATPTPTPIPTPTPPNPVIGTGAPTSHGSSVVSNTTTQPVSLPNIQIQSASLSATKVAPGTPITVTANIANRGTVNGSTRVKVYVNGEEDSSQGITVESGGNRPVYFTVSRSQPGTYDVYIGGTQAGSFMVEPSSDSDIILWLSMACVLAALIMGAFMLWRRQRGYY